MKKVLLSLFSLVVLMSVTHESKAQSLKVGVFDIDLMVEAMPGYKIVDSLMQIYDQDSLTAEREVYELEFHRLDSTYKIDSAAFAQGKIAKARFDYTANSRRDVGLKLVYWQQYAQNKSNSKRSQYAQPL